MQLRVIEENEIRYVVRGILDFPGEAMDVSFGDARIGSVVKRSGTWVLEFDEVCEKAYLPYSVLADVDEWGTVKAVRITMDEHEVPDAPHAASNSVRS